MRTSKYSEQQIIGFLNRATAGEPVAELCRKEGFSQPTFYKWRAKYGGLQVSEAARLRELEGENAKLKKLLAEAMLDINALKGVFGVKPLAPQARREAARRMVQEHRLSERRACRLVGLSRDAYRHPPVATSENQLLSERIKAVALVRRRFGYRRVHDVLRTDFPGVNHKRVYRLYKAADLAVRKRKKAKRPLGQRTLLVAASTVNAVWSMDFVSDSLCNARRIKCLAVANDFSHECVQMAVDFGIGGQYVTWLLDEAAQFRGYPKAVRTDNGPEFTSRAFLGWCERNEIQHILIEPGRPMHNGYIESFNGKFRDECLNEHWFETLAQAREVIRAWAQDYNEVRSHSSIGRMPPRHFARLHRQQAGNAGSSETPTQNTTILQPRTVSE
nr:IS3 family transposase [Paracidovorax anthurii]